MCDYKSRRYLYWHPESECLFEQEDNGSTLLFGECEDVTGIPEWEERFKQQKQKDNAG